MRRLSKNKRKTSETNSEVKQENGDTTDANAIEAESTPKGSKTRKSRNNPEVESSSTPSKRMKSQEDEAMCRVVESILAVSTIKNKRRYKVHWKGFSSDEDSWISENKLSCPEILQDFLRRQKEKKNLPKPINVDGDTEEYEVERVIEVRFKKDGAREFLIRWKGFSSKDDTWEPEENLNCPDLISKFMAKVEKAKSVTSRELRANPVVTERLTLNMKSANLRYSRRPQTQNRPTYHNFLE